MYGYHPHPKIPGRLVEDDQEQEVIRLIRFIVSQNPELGSRVIARNLDSLGLRRRGGKKWVDCPALVAAIRQRAV